MHKETPLPLLTEPALSCEPEAMVCKPDSKTGTNGAGLAATALAGLLFGSFYVVR